MGPRSRVTFCYMPTDRALREPFGGTSNDVGSGPGIETHSCDHGQMESAVRLTIAASEEPVAAGRGAPAGTVAPRQLLRRETPSDLKRKGRRELLPTPSDPSSLAFGRHVARFLDRRQRPDLHDLPCHGVALAYRVTLALPHRTVQVRSTTSARGMEQKSDTARLNSSSALRALALPVQSSWPSHP